MQQPFAKASTEVWVAGHGPEPDRAGAAHAAAAEQHPGRERLDLERLEQIGRVITGQAAPRTRSMVTQVYNGAALLVPGAGVFAFLNDDHHTLAMEAGAATVVVTLALASVWRRRRAKR